jgi:hypothetical protein
MADNQMIKIEFDFDLGNVPASAKKFSQYLKGIGVDLDFTKKSVKQLGDGLDQVGKKMNESGNTIKKSNQQWTNFALIIQDLPYGFRGIQNNLPAVLGGIAGVAGPIYLLGSAVIAFFTAVDNGLIKFGNSTKTAENYSKSFASTLAEETTKLESLYRVSTDSTRSMSDRLEAAKELKKEYPGLLGKYSEEEIALGKAKEGYIDLSKTIAMYAKAKAAEKMIVDITAKSLENEYKINKIIADAGPEPRRFQGNRTTSAYLLYQAKIFNQTKDLREEQTQLSDENKYYSKILDDNVNAMSRLSSAQDDGKKSTKKLEDSTINLLRAKQQYYKDDVIMYAAYEQEILKREEDLAVKQAQIDEKSATDIQNIHKTYEQLRINSAQSAADKILAIQHKLGEEEGKENEKIAEMQQKGRELIAKSILKINEDINKADIKNINDKLAVQVKLVKNNVNAQIKLYKNAIEEVQKKKQELIDAGLPTTGYDAEIENLKNKLEGLGSAWDATARNISNSISGLLADAFTMLGEHIGNLVTGDAIQGINAFEKMLAEALIGIGKMLISYGTMLEIAFASPDPLVAIAAGVAAVALGTIIKNTANKEVVSPTKFADGGIVSGPTMGLMGEYPGAQNNPEVIAPLDKLKEMIGGGGNGQFVLRGQDLVLAMQRSNKSLNIRRG